MCLVTCTIAVSAGTPVGRAKPSAKPQTLESSKGGVMCPVTCTIAVLNPLPESQSQAKERMRNQRFHKPKVNSIMPALVDTT
jgi:hypothetical protein